MAIVHGYGDHIGRWEHVARHFCNAGVAVYAADHLGHGKSEGEPALIERFDDLVDDLGRLLDLAQRRHGDLPQGLLGHSMGGLVAARFAQRSDTNCLLRGMILSAPMLGDWPLARQALDAMGIQGEDSFHPLKGSAGFRNLDKLSRDEDAITTWLADSLVYRGPYKESTCRELLRAIREVDAAPRRIDLPVLHLHGDADEIIRLEDAGPAVARLGALQLHSRVYPGARHSLFNETNTLDVLGDCSEFTRRVIVG